jgi:sterol desaturase/sphingolipid hydroxylase (fatty acid hydroxylase superfamily)
MWSDLISHLDAPEERLFWPYLASALALALLGAAAGRVSLRRDVFSRDLWWHPSARADYLYFLLRAALSAFVIAPLLVSSTVVAVKVVLVLYEFLGQPPDWPLGASGTTALYTALLFITSDASRFLLHKWMHESDVLWRFHQVHHSAEVMTPITLYRTHPVEGLLMALRGVLVTGLVGGLVSYLARGQAVPAEVLGVNAIAFALNLAGANLRHSHVWLSFGPLERLLLSPAQHQLHHAVETGGLGVNYGAFLALWDRLAATWVPAAQRPARFGLPEDALNHSPRSAWSMLVHPFWRTPQRDSSA